MRGFRWQLIALVMSIVIFGMVIIFRFANTPPIEPAQTPMPTSVVQEASATPSPLPPTPFPTQQPVEFDAAQAVENDVLTYREALVGQVQRLNPLLAPLNPVEQDITSLIFEGLV